MRQRKEKGEKGPTFNKCSAANISTLCSAAGSVSSGCIKGRRRLIPLFNCAVKIKQREAGEKCCTQANAGGIGKKEVIKKRNRNGSKTSESGGARKGKK